MKKNKFIKKTAIHLTVMFLCISALIFSPLAYAQGLFDVGYTKKYSKELSNGISKASAFSSSVSAKSAILINGESGQVLYEKDADRRLPMASTTKIMTAIVALENCPIDRIVSISPIAVGTEGSSIYLYEGEELTMEQLLYALLLESANDAAVAIAVEVGGDIDGFAKMMNDKADELGLTDTHFDNPHGLDSSSHYTTARELAKITEYAMKNEKFAEIVSTYKKVIPLNSTEGVRLLLNHNRLLKYYDGTVGVKTGYTKKSGRCLVSAAKRDGIFLICVTLDAPNDWSDHKNLFDYGFSTYESKILMPSGGYIGSAPVISGESGSITISNRDEVRAVLPRSVGEVKCNVELFRFYYAPIQEGDIVGRLVYTYNGEIVGECYLYAINSVKARNYKNNIFEYIFG